jgi:hypothetical protein
MTAAAGNPLRASRVASRLVAPSAACMAARIIGTGRAVVQCAALVAQGLFTR